MNNTQENLNIREVAIQVLKKWYWFVIGLVVCFALGGVYYLRTTPKFKVSTTIMIRNSDDDTNPQAAMMQMMGFGANKAVLDEIEVIKSRNITRQAILDLGLQTEYRKKYHLRWVGLFPTSDISVSYPEQYLDTMKRTVKIDLYVRKNGYKIKVNNGLFRNSRHVVASLSQPIQTIAGEMTIIPNQELKAGDHFHIVTYPMPSVVDIYRKTMTVSRLNRESNVITISTTTDVPQRAIAMMQKIVELYNLDAVVDKNVLATNTAIFINERLKIITEELDSVEYTVEKYKHDNSITDLSKEAELFLENSNIYQNKAADIEMQINMIDYVQDFISQEQNRYSLLPANLGIEDKSLSELIKEYNELLMQRMRVQRTATDANPVLSQLNIQIASMRQNVMTSIASVRESLNISRQTLRQQDAQFATRIQSVPRQERQYIEIKRQQQIKEALYLYLYQKREENALTLASTVMPAKTVDVAQKDPTVASPNIKYIFLVCLILGLGIPAGIMYVYSLFDNKIKDRKQLEKLVRIPFLGQIVENHNGRCLAVREGENSASAELFRTLRTNIGFMLPKKDGGSVIMMTSCINGEGKSYVAINTAASFALLGKKVVLVGLDIRKPMLSDYLKIKDSGCLTSYLADSSMALEDTIIRDQKLNFDFIPSGIIPPNPSELLQSNRLVEFFDILRTRYDYIVVDTAPCAMVSDTFLLDRIADLTVFVSRANYTPREMTNFINDVKDQKRFGALACVLNGVPRTNAGYGYGYGYGYSKDN